MSEPTTKTADQIIEQARAEGWKRKQVKQACYEAQVPVELRDEVYAALGMTTAAENKQAESDRLAAEQAERDEQARTRELAEQVEREQREAKEAEQRERQQAERAELEAVEPHWPTWREVKRLARDWNESCDAARHSDMGDYLAFRGAGEQLLAMAELVMLAADHTAADILAKTVAAGRPMSEPQVKLVALVLAKLASANGMTGAKPVSADTAHKQENITAEFDEIAVEIDRDSPQRAVVRASASKKSGKPYLAVLSAGEGGGWERAFVKRQKLTNSTVRFVAEGLAVGAVLEFRGYGWSADSGSYQGGVVYLLVAHGGLIEVSRRAAGEALAGASSVMIDRYSPVIRFHDEFLPGNAEIEADVVATPMKGGA